MYFNSVEASECKNQQASDYGSLVQSLGVRAVCGRVAIRQPATSGSAALVSAQYMRPTGRLRGSISVWVGTLHICGVVFSGLAPYRLDTGRTSTGCGHRYLHVHARCAWQIKPSSLMKFVPVAVRLQICQSDYTTLSINSLNWPLGQIMYVVFDHFVKIQTLNFL